MLLRRTSPSLVYELVGNCSYEEAGYSEAVDWTEEEADSFYIC
jgi:hypothetical protein